MAVFLVLFTLISVQLFRLQILQGEQLQQRAQAQWTSESVIAPRRGSILDRNGNVLAISATAYIASVSPRQVTDPSAFAQILAPILDMDEQTILKRASDRSKGGVILKRQLDKSLAQELRILYANHRAQGSDALNGLYLEEDSKRYYPMGAYLTQLLGLTTVDGVGQSGLEQSLNNYLSGKSGHLLDEIDGKGRELFYGAREYVPSVDGGDVTLTIDYAIQSFVEQAAREAISVNRAKAVRILVMDPKTGAILAMCNKPDFDLNDPPRNDVDQLNELMRNRLLTDAYEPGSTFKILTTAAAIESKVVSPNEGFYCSGSVMVDGGKIRCWGNPHGSETFTKALCNSCNPVFVELGIRLGVNRFYDYLEAFGLGKPTGVDIPGEASGILIPESACKRVDIARIGFGQSVAVTPIQLLNAACSVINGGNLMKPYIVQQITAADGELIEQAQPEVVSNPISQQTSDTVRSMLQTVVEQGGGRNAYIQGYNVGGKTGTAQVYIDGVVSTTTHIGSFLGFAPVEDPQVAVLVIVDEAAKRPDFGSVTAAPFAKDILEQTLQYLGYMPKLDSKQTLEMVNVPDVSGLTISEAAEALKQLDLQYLISGVGDKVIEQMPAAGAHMQQQSLVMLYVEGEIDSQGEDRATVPDVKGLTIMEANRMMRAYGLEMKVIGSGIAVRQSVAAGDMLAPTSTVEVTFEPPG
ncbi:PASTA domain-containing protein [Eubacteriales bacterium OttesenSCG-928-N13]|nr:PASTA domain-containing protein [Eubacteriales bacterium OttesenSCG-928-N13]